LNCSSCGAANPDDASFCAACGARLSRDCRSCGATLPQDAMFCPACGAPVNEPEPASPAGQERKLVTVLFADVTGSTTLGEQLDPERLRDVLATYFEAMRAEIEAEGGTVEKFIGDAVMAVFGVPQAHEDDPARALRAARRMLERLDEVNEELRRVHDVALEIRVGVHTGDVLAAIEVVPGEPMVTGDVVNTAARLQTAARPGQIVASVRTVRSVPGSRWDSLPNLDLKGKNEMVQAVVILDGPEVSGRGIPGLSAPLVGRDGEMSLLHSTFERARQERRPHLVTIYGEPGVGKSRLVREFLDSAASGGAVTVVQGRCLPYGDGIAYWPLAEILKQRSGIDDRDSPDVVLEKVRSNSGIALASGVDLERTCAALAFTIGVEDPASAISQRDPRQVRNEIHAAWEVFFSALAAEQPLIVVVDDIHWADTSLLDLLEAIADRAEGPMLLLCPTRPTLADRRPTWGGGRRDASSLALDPLTSEQSSQLMTLLLDVDDLPQGTRELVLARAEGNPFFLEEIVRQLIDEGAIEQAEGRWRAKSSLATVTIPDTVQGVLAARIDLLDRDERQALEYAAVVGRVFWPAPVALLLNGSGARLGEMLDRLQARDLVRSRVGSAISGETEFIFKHVLTRDVAYDRLPRADRARAHATVAEWIETTAGTRADFGELLVYHVEEAYRAAHEDPRSDPERLAELRVRAFRSLISAAGDARARFCISKAFVLVDRADAAAEGPTERAQVLEERGRTALTNYEGDAAWRALSEAAEIRLASAPDDALAIARVCARAIESPTRWPGSMSSIPPETEVRRFLEIGLQHAGSQDSVPLVRLLAAQAFMPFAFGRIRGTTDEEVAQSRAVGLRAADMAKRLGRPDLASAALDAASSSSMILGRYGDDLELMETRLALLDEIDDAWEIGDIYAMASWTEGFVGNYERAWDYALTGRTEMDGTDAEGLLVHALSWQAYAGLYLGHWNEVIGDVFPVTEGLLGDRRLEPPYFTQNLFGAVAVIAAAQRRTPLLERLLPIVDRLVAGRGGTGANSAMAAAAWRAWIAIRQGDIATADTSLQLSADIPARGHWPLLLAVRALRLADPKRRAEVDAFLSQMRPWAFDAGIVPLAPSFDRLEGRVRLEDGDTQTGLELITAAVRGFDKLGARWEAACTRLDLARAYLAVDDPSQADDALALAIPSLEELESMDELETATRLSEAIRSA
jgi:class 3 adenylate cyclase